MGVGEVARGVTLGGEWFLRRKETDPFTWWMDQKTWDKGGDPKHGGKTVEHQAVKKNLVADDKNE